MRARREFLHIRGRGYVRGGPAAQPDGGPGRPEGPAWVNNEEATMAEQLRIDPADAQARVDAGEAIVLDVVSPMAWEQLDRAVRGAVRISPDELGER